MLVGISGEQILSMTRMRDTVKIQNTFTTTGQKVFICSDEPGGKKKMKQEFSDNIYYPRATSCRGWSQSWTLGKIIQISPLPLKKPVDFMLLMRCDRLKQTQP